VIGRYRLQPGRGLLADDLPIPIGTKALDIFASLVKAAGELVTKDELMERVLPRRRGFGRLARLCRLKAFASDDAIKSHPGPYFVVELYLVVLTPCLPSIQE
jgi:hypothetical protein